jgi:hypothetical protein
MTAGKLVDMVTEYLRKIGGKGGKRRMETMTPEARSAVAKKAAAKSAEVRTKKAKTKAKAKKPAKEK